MPKTKQQAADFLGVKTRTLELYTQQGRLSVSYAKGKRGRVAQYDDSELEKLKHDLEQETIYPKHGALVANPRADNTSIAKIEQSGFGMPNLLSLLAERLQSSTPIVAVENKPLLTVKECAALTNLSRTFLLDAIHTGRLKGKIIGKGYKVKRADLDSFIKKL
jgi:excisionase family DNA binding protein